MHASAHEPHRPRDPFPGPTAASALPGWDALLTPDGLEALALVGDALEAGETADSLNRRLRAAGSAPELVAAVLTQGALQRKAAAKFGELSRSLLFTPAALEQASRMVVARGHAARFRDAGCRRVADLGCGIGTESIALLETGVSPLAVELDPFTARLAAANLGVVARSTGAPEPEVTCGDATQFSLDRADGAFLDPARRTAGHRDTRRIASPDDYSPSLDFAFGLADRLPVGVKLGPGLDRDLIPDDAEAQWVSVDGQVVETALWFGGAARTGVKRAALVHRGTEAHELTAAADAPDAQVRPLGSYLHEPDGAVIRARLIGAVADELGAGMINEHIAYLTSDTLTASPFVQSFRVLDALPSREKDLRRELAARGIGRLEIKKRGADIDPAQLRTRLKLRGDRSATLVLTRDAAGKHITLLTERC